MRESKFFEEVMADGRLEARRADALQNLEVRFGKSQLGDIEQQLQVIGDEDELTKLHRLAITCQSVAQFQRAMRATTTVK